MMNKMFTSVKLLFMNCDAVTLLPSDIERFSINGIKRSLYWQGDHWPAVLDEVFCEEFMIVIKDDKHLTRDDLNLFDKLGMRDITHVFVTWQDGKEDIITVPVSIDVSLVDSPNPYSTWNLDKRTLIIKK